MADDLPPDATARLRTLMAPRKTPAATLAALDEAWSLLPGPQAPHHPWAIDIARSGVAAARAEGDLYSAWLWLARGHAAAGLIDDGGAARDEFEAVSDVVRDEAEAAVGAAAARTPAGSPDKDTLDADTLDADTLDALALEGNDLLAAGDWQGALAVWQRGLALVPEPKTDHVESLWFWASIGDANHSGEQWAEGERALRQALRCPGGVGNGYVWLRLGQCRQAQGDRAGATEALLAAYMVEGEVLFDDEDPAGWELLATQGLVEG